MIVLKSEKKRKLWLHRINPQLNLVWQGAWPRGFVESARRIYDHELVLFTKGECLVQVESHRYRCGPGSFMIIPPNRVHVSTAVSSEPVYRSCLHFDWVYSHRAEHLPICVFLPGHLKKSGIRIAPKWVQKSIGYGSVPAPGATHQLVQALFSRWTSNDRTARATCRSLLLEVLLRLLSPASRPSSPDRQSELAERVKQRLDEHYTARDSIQDLLEGLGMSYAHQCRVFKHHFGISPLGYINAGRIERAKSLLAAGMVSVKEVAHQAGFDDAAYFSRLFSKTVGVAPSEFRRSSK